MEIVKEEKNNPTFTRRDAALLQVLGHLLLAPLSLFVLTQSRWGFVFFFDAIDRTLALFSVNLSMALLQFPFGEWIVTSTWFTAIANSILIVVFAYTLTVSTFILLSKIVPAMPRITLVWYVSIIGLIVFLFSAFEVVSVTNILYNNLFPAFEGASTGSMHLDTPIMANIVLRQSTFWYHAIPYVILCLTRGGVSAILAYRYLRWRGY